MGGVVGVSHSGDAHSLLQGWGEVPNRHLLCISLE